MFTNRGVLDLDLQATTKTICLFASAEYLKEQKKKEKKKEKLK